LQTLKYYPQTVIIYDNVNFKNTIRDKILGYIIIIYNLITTTIVIYLKLSNSDFQQSIHDRTKNLNIWDIFNTPAIFSDDNGIEIRIFIYFIFETIKKIYKSAINAIFNNSSSSLKTETAFTIFIIPEINRIAIYKIKF
jgi:hypothetical protein